MIDTKNKVVIINKTKDPRKKYNISDPGELLDTLVHETLHAKYPNLTEQEIRKKTMEMIATMSPPDKQRFYNFFNK